MKVVFQPSIFRGCVSFRESISGCFGQTLWSFAGSFRFADAICRVRLGPKKTSKKIGEQNFWCVFPIGRLWRMNDIGFKNGYGPMFLGFFINQFLNQPWVKNWDIDSAASRFHIWPPIKRQPLYTLPETNSKRPWKTENWWLEDVGSIFEMAHFQGRSYW